MESQGQEAAAIELCSGPDCTRRQRRAASNRTCIRGFCLSCCTTASITSFLKCPAPRHPKKSPSNEPVPIENPPIEPRPSDPVTPKAVRSYGKMLSPTYAQKLLRNQFAVEDESSAALREKYRKEAALIVTVKWWTAVSFTCTYT